MPADFPTKYTGNLDENGVAYGIKHIGNKPRVSAMPYLYDIAEGNVADHLAIRKFGHNEGVGGSLETVWSGSIVYPYMTVADQLEVLSDDADDDDTDTGAWTVKIYGLDGSWNEVNDTVTLDGANPVTTTQSFIRVFRAEVVTAGTSLINEGTITIRDQDTDTTRALIDPLYGQTLMCLWTVPLGYTFYMTSWYGGSAISKEIEMNLMIRDADTANAAFQTKRHLGFTDSMWTQELEIPQSFPAKTDIEIRASAAGGGGHVTAGFTGWYEL